MRAVPKKEAKVIKFTVHLVSDASGTTLLGLARACLAQYEAVEPDQKFWPLIRTMRQLERVLEKIKKQPGPVIFTMVDHKLRKRLQEFCEQIHVPCMAVLDPIFHGLSTYLGRNAMGVPGIQHTLDDAYFRRVSAIDFAMRHDDGREMSDLEKADIILVGVSRTSKTPTSVYLARRGIKAANIPLVPGVCVPEEHLQLSHPLYVGLTADPERLLQLRRSRLRNEIDVLPQTLQENTYLDIDLIKDEVRNARKLYTKHHWPVIDVTKRSIEETSAEILSLYQSFQERGQDD